MYFIPEREKYACSSTGKSGGLRIRRLGVQILSGVLLRNIVNEIDHCKWMEEAIKQAEIAFELDEVPVGAVVVVNNSVVGKGYNMKESLKDPTAHAEIIAITAAANSLGDWRLTEGWLYSTVEPCLMCAGAIIQSRLKGLCFGTDDVKFGAFGSVMDVRDFKWNWDFEVISGIMKEESSEMLKSFFKKRRDG